MRILRRPQTSPYFNIAAEEYFLRHSTEDIFMLWRNEPAVIVGKHQNTLAEINADYTQKMNIPIIRRLSGGGSVFHDLGNICFSFVQKHDKKIKPDFRQFTEPIVSFLQSLGINARFEGRNDLCIDEKKISGNADALYQDKVLHHGTLLFSSQIADMSQCLQNREKKFEDKAVKSVRSRITNISEHLPNPMSVENFIQALEDFMSARYPQALLSELSPSQIEDIEKLVKEKYTTWDWNFGSSPFYNFHQEMRTAEGGTIELCLSVKNGIMEDVRIFGDYFFQKDSLDIEKALVGKSHQIDSIKKVLDGFDLRLYFSKIRTEEIYSLFQ